MMFTLRAECLHFRNLINRFQTVKWKQESNRNFSSRMIKVGTHLKVWAGRSEWIFEKNSSRFALELAWLVSNYISGQHSFWLQWRRRPSQQEEQFKTN